MKFSDRTNGCKSSLKPTGSRNLHTVASGELNSRAIKLIMSYTLSNWCVIMLAKLTMNCLSLLALVLVFILYKPVCSQYFASLLETLIFYLHFAGDLVLWHSVRAVETQLVLLPLPQNSKSELKQEATEGYSKSHNLYSLRNIRMAKWRRMR